MTSVLSIAPQSPHWERYSYTNVSWTGQQNLSTVKTLSDESHISIGSEVTGSSGVIKQPVRSVWVGPGLLKADIRTGLARLGHTLR